MYAHIKALLSKLPFNFSTAQQPAVGGGGGSIISRSREKRIPSKMNEKVKKVE
jgi:hypothetical protein